MTNLLLVVKEQELCPVVERCRFTVPYEDAGAKCRCGKICEIACPWNCPCAGMRWQEIGLEARRLAQHVLYVAETWKERFEKAGFPCQYETMRLHGPWPSRGLNEKLADYQSASFKQTVNVDGAILPDPTQALGWVQEYDPWAFAPYSDYVLTATFLKPEFREYPWAGGLAR